VEQLTHISAVRDVVRRWKAEGLRVGLVPTMGYLHAGHQSLIERAAAENDRVVVSVFVNPMQFGPKEDLATYPRDAQRDDAVCEAGGAHVVFRPAVEEMYPEGFCTYVDMTHLTEGLCGASRPGHFRGVCTVVCKLFGIVRPHSAYFGQKDAQQLAVIRRMARDLNLGVDVVACPIVREADGLAMSSRNSYLGAEERTAALCLSRALALGRQLLDGGETDASVLTAQMRQLIEREALARIDYISVVDADNLQPVEAIAAPVLCALAVFVGKTRLIDNFIHEGKGC
jgi:pantoate--beta-alanine ligase